MNTIYLLFGLLLGFIIGMIVGYGAAKTIIDESIKRAWIELIINAPKVNALKKTKPKEESDK